MAYKARRARLFTLSPHNLPASSFSLRLAVCFLLLKDYVDLPGTVYDSVIFSLAIYLGLQMLRDLVTVKTSVDIFEKWNYEKGSHDEADANSN